MVKVRGVGGIFFKAADPPALADFYARSLGFEIDAGFGGTTFAPSSMPPGGLTVWSPFRDDTEYFAPSTQRFMFNLVVDDVRAALVSVEAQGGTPVGDVQEESYGTFGWFLDPEGNKVELWAPAAPPAQT